MAIASFTNVTYTSFVAQKETASDIPNLAERVNDYFKQLGYDESFILSKLENSVWCAFRKGTGYHYKTQHVRYDELEPQISEEDLWE